MNVTMQQQAQGDLAELTTIETGKDETVRADLEDWHQLSPRAEGTSKSIPSPFKSVADTVLRPFGYRASRIPRGNGQVDSHQFWNELHHKSYGRPWCLGRDHFNYLISRGLSPSDTFLDLGCGALRTGIFVIPYLDVGRYYGVEAHRLSLEAAANYEIPLNNLADKRPSLLHSSKFDLKHWNVTFDWIFAFALFKLNHVDLAMQRVAFTAMAETLASNGRIVLSPSLVDQQVELVESLGFRISHEELTTCRLLDDKIEWMELVRK